MNKKWTLHVENLSLIHIFFSLRKFLSFSYERGRVTVKIMLSSPLAASMEPP